MHKWAEIARRVRVPLGFLFAVVYFWLARPTPRSLLLGSFAIVVGLTLRALASGYVRKNEELTTGGPYAYTRNPLYLGSLILAAGFAFAARSWWIAAGIVALFVMIYIPVILAEEEYLRQRFPAFSDYAREVPRLFPRLRIASKIPGGFSCNLYCKHREYQAAAGSIAMLLVLVGKMLWMRS